MRKVVLDIAMLGAVLAGIWVAFMVGVPELDDSTAILGRFTAVVLGVFAAVGISAIWLDRAQDLDFKGWLRRMRGKGKDR